MIVHFPIALLLISVALELLTLVPALRDHLRTAAFITLLLGTAGAAVAVISGPDENARGVTTLMHAHENFAHLTLILFGALSVWRLWSLWRTKSLAVKFLPVYLALAVIGVGLLSYTGHLGGRMVYEDAVGVSRGGQLVAPPVQGHRPPRK